MSRSGSRGGDTRDRASPYKAKWRNVSPFGEAFGAGLTHMLRHCLGVLCDLAIAKTLRSYHQCAAVLSHSLLSSSLSLAITKQQKLESGSNSQYSTPPIIGHHASYQHHDRTHGAAPRSSRHRAISTHHRATHCLLATSNAQGTLHPTSLHRKLASLRPREEKPEEAHPHGASASTDQARHS